MNQLTTLAVVALFAVIAVACAINATRHARDARRHADAARDLECARIVWHTATMGDDGVICVNMAEEDRWRAENKDYAAFRREMLAARFSKGGRA